MRPIKDSEKTSQVLGGNGHTVLYSCNYYGCRAITLEMSTVVVSGYHLGIGYWVTSPGWGQQFISHRLVN